MLTLFKKVEVINKKIKTPDYSFINGDYFSDENNWIELFNKEKDICILIEDNIEYLKFVIRYYKTILENITEKELYVLYHLSLCKENYNSIDFNEFIKYCSEEKYNLSQIVKYKIYPELPIEFFISTILIGNNEIINEKMKHILYEYLYGLYKRFIEMSEKNISLINQYTSKDFSSLTKYKNSNEFPIFNELTSEKIDKIILDIKKSLLKEDNSYKFVDLVKEVIFTGDYVYLIKENIKYLKNNPYGDVFINELNDFDFYNVFVVYYIYELFYENDIETLKRISLTWI